MRPIVYFFPLFFALGCKSKGETVTPVERPITESVYASGLIKAGRQYQAFASANGILTELFVKAGDTVSKGQALLKIFNQAQLLNRQNAELTARYADLKANKGQLYEAKLQVDLALNKLKNDSLLFARQRKLDAQQIGTKVELEQRELAVMASRASYYSAKVRAQDLRRQLQLSASQSLRNLEISSTIESDYILKSEIDGIVYELFREKGEIISPQTPLAIIGEVGHFILEMQIDEYDIFKIHTGLKVLVSLDSYRDKVFEARLTKIYPIMNERSKTFLAEAEFVKAPTLLLPNVTFEANLILREKNKALLIPRNCLVNDSTVLLADGKEHRIKTGLKDYRMIEVLNGLQISDKLLKPKK